MLEVVTHSVHYFRSSSSLYWVVVRSGIDLIADLHLKDDGPAHTRPAFTSGPFASRETDTIPLDVYTATFCPPSDMITKHSGLMSQQLVAMQVTCIRQNSTRCLSDMTSMVDRAVWLSTLGQSCIYRLSFLLVGAHQGRQPSFDSQ